MLVLVTTVIFTMQPGVHADRRPDKGRSGEQHDPTCSNDLSITLRRIQRRLRRSCDVLSAGLVLLVAFPNSASPTVRSLYGLIAGTRTGPSQVGPALRAPAIDDGFAVRRHAGADAAGGRTAFKRPRRLSITPGRLQPTLENFARILPGPVRHLSWNSSARRCCAWTGRDHLAILAAYAFARWEFRGRDLLFACVLGALMVPHTLTMIPIYLMIAELGWFDTWTALIVPNLAFPFGVFLLRQHMLAFPKELIEAAAVDGAGPFHVLWSISLPNMGRRSPAS